MTRLRNFFAVYAMYRAHACSRRAAFRYAYGCAFLNCPF